MMTVIVTVSEAARLPVSGNKTDTMLLRTLGQTTLAPPLAIEAAGHMNKQTAQFLHLGGIMRENTDLSLEIDGRIHLLRACPKRLGPGLYDRTTAPHSLKVRMLKAEVTETLLFGCVTWTLGADQHFAKLRTAPYQVLLRAIGFRRRLRIDHTTPSRTRRPSR